VCAGHGETILGRRFTLRTPEFSYRALGLPGLVDALRNTLILLGCLQETSGARFNFSGTLEVLVDATGGAHSEPGFTQEFTCKNIGGLEPGIDYWEHLILT
jgi:hypothetical protein